MQDFVVHAKHDDVGEMTHPSGPEGGPRPRVGGEARQEAGLLSGRLDGREWRGRSDLRFVEDRRADHSERAWSRRAHGMLEYLFGQPEFQPSDAN